MWKKWATAEEDFLCPRADDDETDEEQAQLLRLLAQRSRQRRDSAAREWLPRGADGSDSDNEEDEDGFVPPPGWRSVRQTAANGERRNAFVWTDGRRTANSLTAAWDMHRSDLQAAGGASAETSGLRAAAAREAMAAGGSGVARWPAPEDDEEDDEEEEEDLLTSGLPLSELLESLLLGEDEAGEGQAGGAPGEPAGGSFAWGGGAASPRMGEGGGAEVRGAGLPPGPAAARAWAAQESVEAEVEALLQDESLQEELLQLFGDLLTEEEGAALGLAEGNAGEEDRMGVDQGGGAGGGEVVDLDELD